MPGQAAGRCVRYSGEKSDSPKPQSTQEADTHLAASSEGGQPGQRLLPRAADAHQQGVAAVHADDAVHAGQVLQGVIKEHQVHLGVALVVFLQNLLCRHREQRGRCSAQRSPREGPAAHGATPDASVWDSSAGVLIKTDDGAQLADLTGADKGVQQVVGAPQE